MIFAMHILRTCTNELRSLRLLQERTSNRGDTTRSRLYHRHVEEQERALIRRLYDLQVELFNHQGDEINALRKAIESLGKSHEIIGDMLKLTAEIIGDHRH